MGMGTTTSLMTLLAIDIGFLMGLALYCLPSIIAFRKQMKNFKAILALNLLLGWSGYGWIVALVWSLTSDTSSRNEGASQ